MTDLKPGDQVTYTRRSVVLTITPFLNPDGTVSTFNQVKVEWIDDGSKNEKLWNGYVKLKQSYLMYRAFRDSESDPGE